MHFNSRKKENVLVGSPKTKVLSNGPTNLLSRNLRENYIEFSLVSYT